MTRFLKLDDGHIRVVFRRAKNNMIGLNCCNGTI